MIYELRIYRCVPGRKPALLSRFENDTLRIWEKHGIRQAGFWTTLIGKSSQEITYMLAWDSMAEREKRWGRFSRRSRLGRGGRQDREEWPARREHQQPVADANRVLLRSSETMDARINLAARVCPRPKSAHCLGPTTLGQILLSLWINLSLYRRVGAGVGPGLNPTFVGRNVAIVDPLLIRPLRTESLLPGQRL